METREIHRELRVALFTLYISVSQFLNLKLQTTNLFFRYVNHFLRFKKGFVEIVGEIVDAVTVRDFG